MHVEHHDSQQLRPVMRPNGLGNWCRYGVVRLKVKTMQSMRSAGPELLLP